MEISHPWHPHPLFLGDGNEFEDRCSICKKEFDGNPFYACACVDCKYYVHKSCAELPVKIQHHFHPPHPLALRFGAGFGCDSCHKSFRNELRFRCSDCDFDLDVKCALMRDIDTEGKEFITHFTHQHPLTICGKDGDNPLNCFACEKTSSDLIYGCTPCDYFLHKSCAELPQEIQHRFHQPHPLGLQFGYDFTCDSCHKKFQNESSFSCYDCDFVLDVKCALMTDIDTEGKEFITHVTHQHPLTICSKDGDKPLNCSACKKASSDLIYGCTPCDYFLHKSCAQISTHVWHAMHPKHALSLVVKLGICKYCRMYDRTWKYYCSICHFFLDVSCLIESGKDAQNSERSCFLCGKQHLDSDSCVDSMYFINQSCIQLPEDIEHEFHSHKPLLLLDTEDFECDSCHKWFKSKSHYGCEECNFRMDVKCALMPSIQYEESDESIWPVIPHHFKHQHPLQLISEVDDINCSACHTTKLSPIYGCIKCEYFLHQSCLELPIQIEHPFNDSHVLTIQPLRDNFCHICSRKYDGFAYRCTQCLFFIGIECILELGPTVVHKYHSTVEHKYHRHLLCLIENSYSDRCNADNTFCYLSQESTEFKLTKSYSLRCNKCDYNLHFLCGPLPCTIKHKSHIHALKLVDFIVEDDSDEYYCDICEEIRNPRLCVYYCEDCIFFAHVHCVISEIINVFKKNPEKDELKIAGDMRLEYTINHSHDNLTEELLLDLLKCLDATDMWWLSLYFPNGKLFLREEEDPRGTLEQNSSSKVEDDTTDIIEELFFYNDDIFWNIEERLKVFKPCTKYHIQPDECELPVIEVEGYIVTSNFAPHFRTLLMKYGDFGDNSTLSKNAKSVLLYLLCRVLRSMCRTFVVDVTEKQLFTWLYYIKGIRDGGFDLEFVNPFLDCIKRSYFGLRAMKFENEAPGRLDRKIVNLEQKISDIKIQIEELKRHRQQHRVGKVAEESAVMREEYFTEAKKLKWRIAGEGIF